MSRDQGVERERGIVDRERQGLDAVAVAADVVAHVAGGVEAGVRHLDLEPLLDEPQSVVAGPQHPLARRKPLSWKDVARAEWIVYPQESALQPLFDGILAGRPELPVAIETASVVATTMLLERTDMLAVMPRDVAEHYARRRMVAILPLTLPLLLGPIGIVRHADRELSPAALAFADEVRRLAAARGRRRKSESVAKK